MLIVAPIEGFDSLVSLAEADAYHGKYGNPTWASAPEEAKEAALRRGTQYILSRGVKAKHLDPVHSRVAAATAEAGLRALDGALYADLEPQAVRSETVGPLSVSYSFPRNGGRMRFPVIDDLLQGLTLGAGQVALLRA